ncbi:cupin domain-containing protein [Aquihabitans daechungensis]|uniref:cupin domain-containing protein n=1 Tax=Aquihabitans daechungensis TaxID=1052257 RepID=UPI003BA20815
MDAGEVIEQLGLVPHPEGGWYRETWRDLPADGGRGVGSAIYFLLDGHERSHWHRVDAAEAWHHYAGGPLELAIVEGDERQVLTLGADLTDGLEPQAVVPARAWQAARPVDGWVLAGCTVSPAFDFSGFELAPDGWSPSSWTPPGW